LANGTTDANVGGTGKDADCKQLGGSISVMHEATGLYANVAAGYMEDELIKAAFGAAADDRSEFYAVEAGIQQKWIPIGKTTIFGQYYNNEGGFSFRNYGGGVGRITGSELDVYSLGVMQGVDAAAMNFYAIYRHTEAEATTTGAGKIEFQDVDMFMTGAIIKF
jgi:hypothetical protein